MNVRAPSSASTAASVDWARRISMSGVFFFGLFVFLVRLLVVRFFLFVLVVVLAKVLAVPTAFAVRNESQGHRAGRAAHAHQPTAEHAGAFGHQAGVGAFIGQFFPLQSKCGLGHSGYSFEEALGRMATCTSASCASGTGDGAPVIRHCAVVVFGNAMTSRIDSVPAISAAMRSMPKAMPPCGGAPYLSASSRKPNLPSASSAPMPSSSNTALCIFELWMRIDPPPISLPLSTMS